MNTNTCKKLALLTALCLLLSCCAAFALAENAGGTNGDYAYSIPYGNYAVITDYNGQGGQIDIPAEIDGVPVTSISSAAFDAVKDQITDVTIPASVTKISSAFTDCTNLTNVTLMDGLTAISADAFSGCTALTEVIIPSTVETIGAGAFSNCTSLADVVLPEGIKTIGAGAFSGCDSLLSITLPASLERALGNSFDSVKGIYYNGTEAQWAALASQVTLPADATVHFGVEAPAEAPAEEPAAAPETEAPAAEPVHEHTWVAGKDTATCTAGGQIIHTCSGCGATEVEYTPAKGHAVLPSFRENQTLVLTCTACGKEYTDTRINGIQWPASMRDAATVCAERGYHLCKLVERTATCTKGGMSEGIVCSTCGAVLQPTHEMGARGHWFRSWEIIDPGNCVVEGKKQRSCRNCKYVEVKSTGLNLNCHYTCTLYGYRPATCATPGYSGDTYCTRCGRVIYTGCIIPCTNIHESGTEVVPIKPATATQDGVGNLVCKLCRRVLQSNVVIPKTGK